MYHNMVNQILEMMKGFNEQKVTEFPAFKARVHLRNKLVELGLIEHLANSATATLDIEIPLEFAEDEVLMDNLFKVVDEMAILIVNFHAAATEHFGSSEEIFLKMLDGANLKIK